MRRAILVAAICLPTALSASAQDRPRFFDNFDTRRGVQVRQEKPPQPVIQLARTKTPSRLTANTIDKKLLAKTGKSLPRTAQSRTVAMSASEGLADREYLRPAGATPTTTYFPRNSAAGMKGFTTGDALIDSYIVDSSRRYSIDPLLIYAQMHQESSFKIRATSNKGASGLMQLMPGTARRMGVTNIYDPKQNIEGGIKYMRLLLDMFNGDVNLALAGYNAGEGAVMKYGYQIPPYSETREYVRRIGARYASIFDGSYARNYRRVSTTQAVQLEKKESRPLTVYEPNAVAIRLADGRMRLVNQ